MAGTAVALSGAAGLITLLSIFLPHQPQLETEGLAFVSIGAGLVTPCCLPAASGSRPGPPMCGPCAARCS